MPSPSPGNQNANIPLCGASLAVLVAPTEIVSVVDTGAEAINKLGFAKLQVTPVGNPEQPSDAVPVKVLEGLSVTVIVPDFPEATVSEGGAAVTLAELAVTPPFEPLLPVPLVPTVVVPPVPEELYEMAAEI